MSRLRRTPTRPREWVFVISAALAIAILMRAFVVQSFEVTSSSMESTLLVHDRVIVDKVSPHIRDVRRGDVVVFDGAGSYVPMRPDEGNSAVRFIRRLGTTFGFGQAADEVFVKRVVGIGGDRIVCCDSSGKITINGTVLSEPYLHSGDSPSTVNFDVTVPEGKLWLMGDHRSVSADSRAHLGSPGGGMVPQDRVIGRAMFVLWPTNRIGSLTFPTNK